MSWTCTIIGKYPERESHTLNGTVGSDTVIKDYVVQAASIYKSHVSSFNILVRCARGRIPVLRAALGETMVVS